MQRWTALGLVALLAAFVATVFVAGTGPRARTNPVTAVADAGTDAAADAATEAGPPSDAGDAPAPSPTDEPAAAPGGEPPIANRDAGATLIDGTQAPALAGDAPKSLTF